MRKWWINSRQEVQVQPNCTHSSARMGELKRWLTSVRIYANPTSVQLIIRRSSRRRPNIWRPWTTSINLRQSHLAVNPRNKYYQSTDSFHLGKQSIFDDDDERIADWVGTTGKEHSWLTRSSQSICGLRTPHPSTPYIYDTLPLPSAVSTLPLPSPFHQYISAFWDSQLYLSSFIIRNKRHQSDTDNRLSITPPQGIIRTSR